MNSGPRTMLRWLGLKIQGDIGDVTCYTSQKNRLVWYLRAPPRTPPSVQQIGQRGKFTTTAIAWNALPSTTRQNWRDAARMAHLRIDGYALWTFHLLTNRPSIIQTIEHQTGITLLT